MEPITSAPGDEAANYIEQSTMPVVAEAIDRILAEPPTLGTEVAVFESYLRAMNPRRRYRERVLTLPKLPPPKPIKPSMKRDFGTANSVATSGAYDRRNSSFGAGGAESSVMFGGSQVFESNNTSTGLHKHQSMLSINNNSITDTTANLNLPAFSAPAGADGSAAVGGNNFTPVPTSGIPAADGEGIFAPRREPKALPSQFTLKFTAMESGRGGGSAAVQVQRRKEEEQLRRMGLNNDASSSISRRQRRSVAASTLGKMSPPVGAIPIPSPVVTPPIKMVNPARASPGATPHDIPVVTLEQSHLSTTARPEHTTTSTAATGNPTNNHYNDPFSTNSNASDDDLMLLDKCKELPIFVGDFPWTSAQLAVMMEQLIQRHQMRHITFVVASTPSIAVKLDDGFMYRADIETPLWNLATRQLIEEVLQSQDPKAALESPRGDMSASNPAGAAATSSPSSLKRTPSNKTGGGGADNQSPAAAGGKRRLSKANAGGGKVTMNITPEAVAAANGSGVAGEGGADGSAADVLTPRAQLSSTPQVFGRKLNNDRLVGEKAAELLTELGIDPKVLADADHEETDRVRRVDNARKRETTHKTGSKLRALVQNVMDHRRKAREQIAQGMHVAETKAEMLLKGEFINTNALLDAIDDERLENSLIKFLFPNRRRKGVGFRDDESPGKRRESFRKRSMSDSGVGIPTAANGFSPTAAFASSVRGEGSISPTNASLNGRSPNGKPIVIKSRMSTTALTTALKRSRSFGLAETALRAAREKRIEAELRQSMSVSSGMMMLRDAARTYLDSHPEEAHTNKTLFKYHRLFHASSTPVSVRATDRLYDILSAVPKEHDACVVILGFNQSVLVRHIATLASIYFKIVREVQAVNRAFTLYDAQERVQTFIDVDPQRRRLARNRAERDARRALIAEQIRPKIRAIEQVESPAECRERLERAARDRQERLERRQRNDEMLASIDYVQRYNASVKIQSAFRGWMDRRYTQELVEAEQMEAQHQQHVHTVVSYAQALLKEFREGKSPFINQCMAYLEDALGPDMVATKAPRRGFNRTMVLHERQRHRVPPSNEDDISSEDEEWVQKVITQIVPGTACPLYPVGNVIAALHAAGSDDISYLVEVVSEYGHVEPMQRKASSILEKLVQYMMFAAFAAMRIKIEFGYSAPAGSLASSVFLQIPTRFQPIQSFADWMGALPLPMEWARQFPIYAHAFSKDPAPLLSHRMLLGGPLANGAWLSDAPEEENPVIAAAAAAKAAKDAGNPHNDHHNSPSHPGRNTFGPSATATQRLRQSSFRGGGGGGGGPAALLNRHNTGITMNQSMNASGMFTRDGALLSGPNSPNGTIGNTANANNANVATGNGTHKDDYSIVCPRRLEIFDNDPIPALQAPVYLAPECLTDVQWEELAKGMIKGERGLLHASNNHTFNNGGSATAKKPKVFNRIVWVSTCPHPCVIVNGSPMYVPERKSILQRHCINNPTVKDSRSTKKDFPDPFCFSVLTSYAPPTSVPEPRSISNVQTYWNSTLTSPTGTAVGGGLQAMRSSRSMSRAPDGTILKNRNGPRNLVLSETPLLATGVTREDRPQMLRHRLLTITRDEVNRPVAAPQKPNYIYLAEIEAALITELVEHVPETNGVIEYHPAAGLAATEMFKPFWDTPTAVTSAPTSPGALSSNEAGGMSPMSNTEMGTTTTPVAGGGEIRVGLHIGGAVLPPNQQHIRVSHRAREDYGDELQQLIGELAYEMYWGGTKTDIRGPNLRHASLSCDETTSRFGLRKPSPARLRVVQPSVGDLNPNSLLAKDMVDQLHGGVMVAGGAVPVGGIRSRTISPTSGTTADALLAAGNQLLAPHIQSTSNSADNGAATPLLQPQRTLVGMPARRTRVKGGKNGGVPTSPNNDALGISHSGAMGGIGGGGAGGHLNATHGGGGVGAHGGSIRQSMIAAVGRLPRHPADAFTSLPAVADRIRTTLRRIVEDRSMSTIAGPNDNIAAQSALNCFQYHRIPLKYGHLTELVTTFGDLYELLVANADEPRTAFVFAVSDPIKTMLCATAATIVYELDIKKSYQRALNGGKDPAAGTTNAAASNPNMSTHHNTTSNDGANGNGGGGDRNNTTMSHGKDGGASMSTAPVVIPPKRRPSGKPNALEMFPFLARIAEENIGIELGRASTTLDEILVSCDVYDTVIGDAARSVMYAVLCELPDDETLPNPHSMYGGLSPHLAEDSVVQVAAEDGTVVEVQLTARRRKIAAMMAREHLDEEEIESENEKRKKALMTRSQLRYCRRTLLTWLDDLQPEGWATSEVAAKAAAMSPTACKEALLSPFGPIISLDEASKRFEQYFTLILFTSFVRLSCDTRRVNAATGKNVPRFEDHVFYQPAAGSLIGGTATPSQTSSAAAAATSAGNGANLAGILTGINTNAIPRQPAAPPVSSHIAHQLTESLKAGIDMWEGPRRVTGEDSLETDETGTLVSARSFRRRNELRMHQNPEVAAAHAAKANKTLEGMVVTNCCVEDDPNSKSDKRPQHQEDLIDLTAMAGGYSSSHYHHGGGIVAQSFRSGGAKGGGGGSGGANKGSSTSSKGEGNANKNTGGGGLGSILPITDVSAGASSGLLSLDGISTVGDEEEVHPLSTIAAALARPFTMFDAEYEGIRVWKKSQNAMHVVR